MTIEPVLVVELLALGLGSGFLAGLLGIGGGMVMVPFLTAMLSSRGVQADVAVKVAIATSMATIVFTSLSSVRAHHKRGAVRWDIVRSLALGIVMGAAVASLGIFAALKGSALALLFAGFVGFSASQMLFDKKPKPTRTLPGPAPVLAEGHAHPITGQSHRHAGHRGHEITCRVGDLGLREVAEVRQPKP